MKVTLIAPHEHAGIAYPAGVEIDVPEHDAAWLVKNNVAGVGAAHEPAEAPVDPLTVAASAARAARGAR